MLTFIVISFCLIVRLTDFFFFLPTKCRFIEVHLGNLSASCRGVYVHKLRDGYLCSLQRDCETPKDAS